MNQVASAEWAQLDPLAMVGGPSGGLSDDVTTGGLGSSGVLPKTHLASVDHPLAWFALFAAVTFGFIGASTHLRVGPFRAARPSRAGPGR